MGAEEDKVFDEAFDKAEGTEPPKEPIEPEPKDEPKEEPPVEPPKDELAEPPVEPPKDEEPKFEQRYKSLQGIFNHDKEVWENERKALTEQLEELKKKPEVKKEDALQNLYESLTDEQKASLKEYDEEFDVVSKMEGMKRDVALRKLRDEMNQFKTEILSQLTPTQDFIKESREEREVRLRTEHFGTIAAAHPDFESFRDNGQILKWIETKPKYLQSKMVETYKQGTADEIVELLSDFKTENQIGNDKHDKKEQKRQAMSAVTTKRGAVNASMVVPADYESAFDEALSR
jgi:uncharacterized protein (UPF0147 family)